MGFNSPGAKVILSFFFIPWAFCNLGADVAFKVAKLPETGVWVGLEEGTCFEQ